MVNKTERDSMSDMNDRVALITGASSGIGRATAEAFAAKGASVVLAARRQDELESLVTEIEARGGKRPPSRRMCPQRRTWSGWSPTRLRRSGVSTMP